MNDNFSHHDDMTFLGVCTKQTHLEKNIFRPQRLQLFLYDAVSIILQLIV